MLYAFVCYNNEKVTTSWTPEEDAAVMGKLQVVHEKLAEQGRLGPAVRLMPTHTATTLRKNDDPPFVTDGPYAETKEQLLGFYVIDCEDMKQAQEVARDLARANPGGAYEIRPVMLYLPGVNKG
ncbi:MAG: YciI family protein [Gammaproteobacteria bacterium]|nr:YciI family protein [Gammaproteobacteria bacterium]